ncbi:hypothetical protein G6F57_007989 [Rhizopus arrhizus]|uniref:C2H2-type domain-containing protein n=1 Tax=Rhizopus oryzae TaxID=64495 RepID=A0A9P7BMD8_RHIOR|nr:hypothetical protein G6F24_007722 [Rhizopus arrhizus]KAG1395883.1 hypothetical protein G6F58_011849 [Rhizopus delemar]KAG0931015.1 hypothetical protein G6F32_011820 [Rhizopus arrhizus]KAG0936305.1 hypothetical protein G6F30_008878 [Rhizopus arrhizus]KAG0978731.1 hypothetical protein G6F29_009105 [Rhizopus arrhizus]
MIKRPFINVTLTTTFKAKTKPKGKLYVCPQCTKPFTRPSALQTHIYTHTGERPHACDMPGCGRRFTVISNLRRHLRVHQQPHSRRRLTAEQRRAHVKELMQRKKVTALTDADDDIIGWFFPPPPLSVGCPSSPSSVSSSPPTSPSLNMPYLESSNFRLLKPKMRSIRPECLSIKNLLN